MLEFPKLGVIATTTFIALFLQGLPCTTWTWTGDEDARSNHPTSASVASTIGSAAVCPTRRSINYITDTLPQQCLRAGGLRFAPLSEGPSEVKDNTISLTAKVVPSTTINEGQHLPGLPSPAAPIWSDSPSARRTEVGIPTSLHSASSSTDAAPTVAAGLRPMEEAKAEMEMELDGDGDPDPDGDSPLDTAKFLSFEEWKKQNLAKVGQTLDHLAGRKDIIGDPGPRGGRPASINNALDSLGEDTEIDIDFRGFVNPGSTASAVAPQGSGAPVDDVGERTVSTEIGVGRALPSSHLRSRDAGKTCKERFNYASFDCAATILKTNKECKGSTSVLIENKDSYMLNQCSADNKFFIVELCDDILVDTIVLGNFEFFSSMFRTFRVSVSDQYPVKLEKWRELGTFEARNSREVQAFLVESPLIWARYLRIEFLAHYGSEYYCPVSLIRVHGTTMMEEFNHEMKGLRGEEADGEIGDEAEDEVELSSDSGVVMADILKEKSKSLVVVTEENAVPNGPPPFDVLLSSDHPGASNPTKTMILPMDFSVFEPRLGNKLQAIMQGLNNDGAICAMEDGTLEFPSASPIEVGSRSGRNPDQAHPPSASAMINVSVVIESPSHPSVATAPDLIASASVSDVILVRDVPSSTKTATPASPAGVRPHTSTQPASANPTTQESFFKTVHKRLQSLEANSTLSLQYIEEQSRMLRDAFTQVEKRQLHKLTTFLDNLNGTVSSEVRHLQTQYDQLWQSTVLELSAQRELSRHEMVALGARINLLADEMAFQKRMAVLQSMLILLCLSLIVFTRAPTSFSPRRSPTRPEAACTEFPALIETADSSGSSTRPSSRYGISGRGHDVSPSPSGESRRENEHERELSQSSATGGGGGQKGRRSPKAGHKRA